MQLTINNLGNFFPEICLTFSKIPDISLTECFPNKWSPCIFRCILWWFWQSFYSLCSCKFLLRIRNWCILKRDWISPWKSLEPQFQQIAQNDLDKPDALRLAFHTSQCMAVFTIVRIRTIMWATALSDKLSWSFWPISSELLAPTSWANHSNRTEQINWTNSITLQNAPQTLMHINAV